MTKLLSCREVYKTVVDTSLYDLLGTPADATPEQIAKSARRLLAQLHPDVAGDDRRDEFDAVTRARDILLDPVKRAAYDREGILPTDYSQIEREATSILADMLGDIIQHDDFEWSMNPLTMVNSMVSEELVKIDNDVHRHRRNLKRLRKLLKRLKPKGANASVAVCMRKKLADGEQILARVCVVRRIKRRVQEMTQEYTFETDTRPAPTTRDYTSEPGMLYSMEGSMSNPMNLFRSGFGGFPRR